MCVGASTVAPSIQDVQSQKFSASYADDLLCIANFGGTPSITIPYKKVDGLPFGLNFNCKLFEDQKLFNVALTFEEIFEKNGGADE
jgi:aspartyl-tRNA(Asn)/glutamyl-tRNA(Gln) amidotransferase subunit A